MGSFPIYVSQLQVWLPNLGLLFPFSHYLPSSIVVCLLVKYFKFSPREAEYASSTASDTVQSVRSAMLRPVYNIEVAYSDFGGKLSF